MTTREKESPRGFAVFVQQLDSGRFHSDLSRELQRVTGVVQRHAQNTSKGASGSITIEIGLAANGAGVMSVSTEIKTKEPRSKRAPSTFFVTEGMNLSVDNPRQTKLPLAAVPDDEAEEAIGDVAEDREAVAL